MANVYRLYIDETGDHTYGEKVIKQFKILKAGNPIVEFPVDDYPELNKAEKRYLGLVGCIVEKEYYNRTFKPSLEQIKIEIFPSHSEDKIVIFHRKDIINKRGAFGILNDIKIEEKFNKAILNFIENQVYIAIAVVIDKLEHVNKYVRPFQPYHYCLAALLERYCGFLKFKGARGDVMAETRGGVEDTLLKAEYENIYNNGTKYYESDFFQNVLTSKEIKIKRKIDNIAGLQLCDLIAFPSKQEILEELKRIPPQDPKLFGKIICDKIELKYNRRYQNKQVWGYGKVFLGTQ